MLIILCETKQNCVYLLLLIILNDLDADYDEAAVFSIIYIYNGANCRDESLKNNNNTLTMSHSIAVGDLGRVSSIYNTI